ncbi:serum paraoxonase/arylesterase 2 [Paecilomyces variotii No. 5]|uniref:Serum paraoxonase/arylesterase 2 n=1 Tax=Byssochlamys spectabilis (strain No. 5 / NBRC 109023) TaxID=1356009 RepID=V5G7L8_BYSSN|nr:serum paraoxonase/arylesterase 2 [Paecilomyces variotii No. 5]
MTLPSLDLRLLATLAAVSGSALFLCRTALPFIIVPSIPTLWLPFRKGKAEVLFKDIIKYSEDIILDPEYGVAIVSSDGNRAKWNTVMGPHIDPNPKGSLHIYTYASERTIRKVRLIGLPEGADFHPLGINYFRGAHGERTRLFVVNHERTGCKVAIFDIEYDKAEAQYVTSISDGGNHILSPNAVAPISYTSFYVTNDHYFVKRRNPLLNILETAFAMPLGWVTLVDFSGEQPAFKTAATGIAFANGIVITPTGKEVAVASTSGSCIYIYERNPDTNELSDEPERIEVYFHPDNLSFNETLDVKDPTVFDEDGKFLRGLIAGGAPSARKIFAMARNPEQCNAPSIVAEIRRGNERDPAPFAAGPSGTGKKYRALTLYQSNGEHFPTSTTGDMDSRKGRLLISGLYAHGILEISWDPNDPSE